MWLSGPELPLRSHVTACITLYNEPLRVLLPTLISLIENHHHMKTRRPAGEPLVSCLLIDGEAHLHPEVRALLLALGWTPSFPAAPSDDNSVHIQHLSLSLDTLHTALNLPADGDARPMPLLIAAKQHNRGKLDSHAWFFRHICRLITPDYILQIDAGSIPAANCLPLLLDHMALRPDCGALAARIVTRPPSGLNPVTNWQYGDFIWEKITDWPVSNLLRYMEVVPGQCSLIRYSTFCSSHDAVATPMHRYLRGLAAQGLLERNQFLAEDRVLGFEIVNAPHHQATTEYEPNAVLETDPCPTFAELVRQRRRWINSTLAVRIATLSALPALLRHAALSPMRKLEILLSMLWNYSQLLTLFVFPALMAVICSLTVNRLVPASMNGLPASQPLGSFAAGGFILFWAGILLCSRIYSVSSPWGLRLHRLLASLLAVTINLLLVTGPVLQLFWHYPGGSLSLLALVLLAVALHSPDHFHNLWRFILLYFPLFTSFSFYLTSYALANFSDTSWGTKGLLHGKTTRRWSMIRDGMLIFWVVAASIMAAWVIALGEQAAVAVITGMVIFTLARYVVAILCSVSALFRKPITFAERFPWRHRLDGEL
ncbi:glycosyltransferase family 2 protein [Musicola paradisiaca]|nr:glycosyltransferase family 2 protein [Musicola paradisiaca]